MQLFNYLERKKYILWGIGNYGKNFIKELEKEIFVAIIESNKDLIDTRYEGIDIISYEEYKEKYYDLPIIATPVYCDEIVAKLEKDKIYKYFVLNEVSSDYWRNKHTGLSKDFPMPNNKNSEISICGINLFVIALYNYLKSMGYNNIDIIPVVKMSRNDIAILEYFGLLENVKLDYIDKKYNIVYFSHYSNLKYQEFKKIMNYDSICNTYDTSTYSSQFANQELKRFKDIHKNEKCFIVATGPSLRMKDLDLLKEKNIITIGMNNIFKAFEDTKWRPDYYICIDKGGLIEWQDKIINAKIPVKLIGSSVEILESKSFNNEIYIINDTNNIVKDEEPKFTEDFSKVVYLLGTVTYICLQWAVYCGFKEIYLLGVDFTKPDQSQMHKYHFIDSYYEENSEYSKKEYKFDEKGQTLCYEKARKVADKKNIKIYNATRGGELEVFQRVNFDEIMF